MYPLATINRGKTWRIAGPVVNGSAAQAPVAVAKSGVVNARTWFMCCGLNNVVDVTTDAGKHWWQAFLPAPVINVFAGDNPHARLIAIVRAASPPTYVHPRLLAYTSTDGRRWTYDPSMNLIH